MLNNRINVSLAAGLLLLAFSDDANGGDTKPIKASVRAVACGEIDGLNTEVGLCHVIDLTEKEYYLEVRVAAGVNVNGGAVVFGGSFKTMLELTLQFAPGTSKDEAIRSSKAAFASELKSKETKSALNDVGVKFSRITPPKEVLYCAPEDPLEAKLRKALGR